jgi:hypothetical protein
LVLLELDGNDSDFLMMVMIVMVMVLWLAMCPPWNPVSSWTLWASWTNLLGFWCGSTSQSLVDCPTPTWMKPWSYCSLHSPGSQTEQQPLWSARTWSARRWQCRGTFAESWGLPNWVALVCFPCVHGQKKSRDHVSIMCEPNQGPLHSFCVCWSGVWFWFRKWRIVSTEIGDRFCCWIDSWFVTEFWYRSPKGKSSYALHEITAEGRCSE